MAIVVEDGSGKTDAVSFVTAAEATTFADARGFSLPGTDVAIEILLVKACDYIIALEDRFQGRRVEENQRLPFPRYGVVFNGYSVDSDVVPDLIKEAQIRLAISANTTELRPDGTGREVVRQKVGPIETEYNMTGSGTINPQFNQAMDFLKPFFRNSGLLFVERA